MARQSSVKGAYTPLNRSSSGGWARLISSVAIAAFIVFFLGSGGNNSANDDNLRSGQAHHDTSITAQESPPVDSLEPSETTSSTNDYTPEGAVDSVFDEENLDEAVEEVTTDIHEAEEREIKKEESMLNNAVGGVGNLLRIRMGKRFGDTLSATEVEEVAAQVEDQLQQEVSAGLRTEADAIAQREIDTIDSNVEMQEEAGYGEKEIEDGVFAQEEVVVDQLVQDIDDAAARVKDTVETRAAEIEKQILELRLTAKLGKQVKLVIVDDEVQPEASDLNLAMTPATPTVPADPYNSTFGTTTAYGDTPASPYEASAPEDNDTELAEPEATDSLNETSDEGEEEEAGEGEEEGEEDLGKTKKKGWW